MADFCPLSMGKRNGDHLYWFRTRILRSWTKPTAVRIAQLLTSWGPTDSLRKRPYHCHDYRDTTDVGLLRSCTVVSDGSIRCLYLQEAYFMKANLKRRWILP